MAKTDVLAAFSMFDLGGNKMGYSQTELIKIRRELHQIPEIGLEEYETQRYLLAKISELSQEKLTVSTWQTGIIVKVKGAVGKRSLGWRTDMDGLPITEETGLAFASRHPGKMHACGHDCHMTIALGLLANVIEADLADDYYLIFQPAEENEAGGKLMYEAGVFDGVILDELYALHIQPSLPVGTIATKVGAFCAGDCEFRVRFKGKGGHGAYPHLSNDMIVAATQFVQQIQTIVSRNVDPLAGAVVTVASFHAGEATNVIPEIATVAGSIRSLDQEVNQLTQRRLKEIAEGIAHSFQCEVEVILDQKGYLPVINQPETTDKLMRFAEENSEVNFELAQTAMVAEDFGYLLSKFPGTMFSLGVEAPYDLHHNRMSPDERALGIAVDFVFQYFSQLS